MRTFPAARSCPKGAPFLPSFPNNIGFRLALGLNAADSTNLPRLNAFVLPLPLCRCSQAVTGYFSPLTLHEAGILPALLVPLALEVDVWSVLRCDRRFDSLRSLLPEPESQVPEEDQEPRSILKDIRVYLLAWKLLEASEGKPRFTVTFLQVGEGFGGLLGWFRFWVWYGGLFNPQPSHSRC